MMPLVGNILAPGQPVAREVISRRPDDGTLWVACRWPRLTSAQLQRAREATEADSTKNHPFLAHGRRGWDDWPQQIKDDLRLGDLVLAKHQHRLLDATVEHERLAVIAAHVDAPCFFERILAAKRVPLRLKMIHRWSCWVEWEAPASMADEDAGHYLADNALPWSHWQPLCLSRPPGRKRFLIADPDERAQLLLRVAGFRVVARS